MNFSQLPAAPYRMRARLVQYALPAIHDQTIEFIEGQYPRRALLDSAIAFAAYELQETPPAQVDFLLRLGFFPWVEASWELDWALTHALCGNYKVARDSIRRAIELSIVAAFFLSSEDGDTAAQDWLRSDSSTPFFGRSIKKLLVGSERWKALAACTTWPRSLEAIYGQLSDVIHVRGERNATRRVQPFSHCINGHHMARFDAAACASTLDALVDAVRQVATVVVLTNPTLIVGLPVDEKFGLNPPASGLLNSVQAARLCSLLPDELRDALEQLAARDPISRAVTEWVQNLPDLTESEFKAQRSAFEDLLPGLGDDFKYP